MVTLFDDLIEVTNDDPSFVPLRTNLKFTEPQRVLMVKGKQRTIYPKTHTVYYISNRRMYIPAGLYPYLKDYFSDVVDKRSSYDGAIRTKELEIIKNINDYANILDGITLRTEQLMSCKKILFSRRCICQLTTGCFTGDTIVVLDGDKSLRFDELIDNYENEMVYTYDHVHDMVIKSKIKSVHITKYVDSLVKVKLSSGKSICCTPEHPFMMYNGEYKMAKDLRRSDHLMNLLVFSDQYNHGIREYVLSVESYMVDHVPVYDLETESEFHNFAIEILELNSDKYRIYKGVFVHNSGKSEIMCATSKLLQLARNGVMPTTLILEPTVRLVNDMVKRFQKYGIEAVKYSDNRKIIENCINICHPKSVGNDIDKDPNLLDSVEVLFGDEVHHTQSESWRKPTYRMKNLKYSVGVSASAISQEHVGLTDVRMYDYGELLTIGATGPLVMNVTAGSMIDTGKLATPVLLCVDNPADEPMDKNDIANWHAVREIKLMSENRVGLVAESAKFFYRHNRKSLILVNTIEWSRKILKMLCELGLSEYSVASYGGGRFEFYNGEEFISLPSDTMDKFEDGYYKILIGTSHLYEGVDISNLDAIILAFGGKGERLQVQGLGRVLRKTKSGNMAYIVDFTDHCDPVLIKQSRVRMKRYKELIGITDDRTYYNIGVEDFECIFNKYEN